MTDTLGTATSIKAKLDAIHGKMADVSDEEVQAALAAGQTDFTAAGRAPIVFRYSYCIGSEPRYEFALTRTA